MANAAATDPPDRRRYPRFACSGSVEIYRDGARCGWGRVNEISQCGCYVEIFQMLPIGTEVQLRLTCANSLLEVNGRVALHDPGMGMGMEFIGLSPAQQVSLHRIVRSITAESSPQQQQKPAAAAPGAQGRPADQITWEIAQEIIARVFKHLSEKGSLSRLELIEIVSTHGKPVAVTTPVQSAPTGIGATLRR